MYLKFITDVPGWKLWAAKLWWRLHPIPDPKYREGHQVGKLMFYNNVFYQQSNRHLIKLSNFSQLITDDDENASSWRTSNFLKFEFYQQFFDVDTTAVKDRVLYSMVPLPGKSFLQHHIRPKPDLYGPFWVCVTLVFSIAISGNMATYLQKSFEADEDHPIKWHYDFHKVKLR